MTRDRAPIIPTVGLAADEVLRTQGRSKKYRYRHARKMGSDDQGMIMEWYYPDITVTLHWRNGCYRVKETRARE